MFLNNPLQDALQRRQDAAKPALTLRAPGEVARIQAERAELGVATARTHDADALGASGHELRVGGDAASLVFPLLLVHVAAAASGAPLVARITRDGCIY